MNSFNDDIIKALEVLSKGGVILYPTDTIWGIGCDATNFTAVDRVYRIKQRDDSKSMLVLLENPNLILSYVQEVPDVAFDLIELSEKPLTIIFEQAKNLAPNLIARDGTIGIRITREVFTGQLIQRFRKPIVSTSANISGHAAPSLFRDISEEIKNQVDFIVSYRQDDYAEASPSSIIKIGTGGVFTIIRR